MKRPLRLLLGAILASTVAGCSPSKDEPKNDPQEAQQNKDAMKKYEKK